MCIAASAVRSERVAAAGGARVAGKGSCGGEEGVAEADRRARPRSLRYGAGGDGHGPLERGGAEIG